MLNNLGRCRKIKRIIFLKTHFGILSPPGALFDSGLNISFSVFLPLIADVKISSGCIKSTVSIGWTMDGMEKNLS